MKTRANIFCTAALMSVLCAGFVACDEPKEQETGLGKEIPGMETYHATGTVIGSYNNGFASLLVQVDDGFPIGKTIEPVEYKRLYTSLPENVTYRNVIQVQCKLPTGKGYRISFSFREYRAEKDFESLFAINGGTELTFGEQKPDVPIYVITKYEIITVKD